MSPALSGGGYSSEAITFAIGLAPIMGDKFRLRQFAEQPEYAHPMLASAGVSSHCVLCDPHDAASLSSTVFPRHYVRI